MSASDDWQVVEGWAKAMQHGVYAAHAEEVAECLARLRDRMQAEAAEARELADEVARLREREAQLERERGDYKKAANYIAGREARVARLEEALREYAKATNWAIGRDFRDGPECIWIGEGALENPPNAVGIARRALAHKEEK